MSVGRTHAAAITSVDEERRVVSVEWFENGETKGKEVRKWGSHMYTHTYFSTAPPIVSIHVDKAVLYWALFRNA